MEDNSALSDRDAPQSELLPCAHCGSQCFEQREEGEVMNLFKIICTNVDCGAQTCGWGLRSSARKAWNRRPPAEGGWREVRKSALQEASAYVFAECLDHDDAVRVSEGLRAMATAEHSSDSDTRSEGSST